MKLNKKGFTLIEIIVSIAIGSIVLLIAGAIILSSSNFLMTTTEMDMDKRCVDSVVDFVRSEILYATDARLMPYNADNAPTIGDEEGWHCFYVKDKVLYRDDANVFSDDFYSHKEFKLSAKGNYQNGSRIDLFYELWNVSHEKTYSTKDTVMLLNVQVTDEIKSEGLFTQREKQLTDTGYALYYKKGNSTSNSGGEDNTGEETGLTGTVADQLEFLSFDNNRWEYVKNTAYRYGDFVYYNNYWWMKITNSENQTEEPGQTASHWKRITAEFTLNSRYEKDDVVIYNGEYYRRKSNANWNEAPSSTSQLWTMITESDAKLTKYDPKINKNETKDSQTIISKLKNIDLSKISDYHPENNNNYPVYTNSVPSDATGFVKILFDSSIRPVYKYYYRVYNNDAQPGQKSTNKYVGWQEVKLDYNENSAYCPNDIIISRYNGGDKTVYFKTNIYIITESSIQDLIDYINAKKQGEYTPNKLYSDFINPSSGFTANNDFVWKKLF